MTKILAYKGGDYCERKYYDASTPERLAAAYLHLFRFLDKLELYEHLKVPAMYIVAPRDHPEGCQCYPCLDLPKKLKRREQGEAKRIQMHGWYCEARAGSARAAEMLLLARRDYRNEEIEFVELEAV
jgi:hypothetical protein